MAFVQRTLIRIGTYHIGNSLFHIFSAPACCQKSKFGKQFPKKIYATSSEVQNQAIKS